MAYIWRSLVRKSTQIPLKSYTPQLASSLTLARSFQTSIPCLENKKDKKTPPQPQEPQPHEVPQEPQPPSSQVPHRRAPQESRIKPNLSKITKIKPKQQSKSFKSASARDTKSNMFNPKEYEQNSDDSPPLTNCDKFLTLQLPFRPVYPGASTYIVSGDTGLINALKKLKDDPQWDHKVMAVMSKTPIKTTQLVESVEDVHSIGCVCLIDNITVSKIPDTDSDTIYAILFPMFRAKTGEVVRNIRTKIQFDSKSINDPSEESPVEKLGVPCMKNITAVPNEPYAIANDEIQRLCVRIIDSLREISLGSSGVKRLVDEFSALVPQSPGGVFPQPDFLADFAASILPKNDMLQSVLNETNVSERLKIVAELASKEVTYLRVQDGIARYGHSQTELRNREMILHEYLRYIKKELGLDGDDKTKSSDKFSERAAKLEMPEEVKRVFTNELNKFRSLEPTSGEYNTLRTYLDWLTSVPWGQNTTDKFDLTRAAKVLNESHYGMNEVKDRILEFLAVGKLNGTVDGKIVCLSGPPGVGKTSIAKSVAEALGRKFDRFSVGGLHDASEIKGHRRTYVAALPGRIVQGLKRTKSMNPVILIDEIDKIGNGGVQGSPSSALLEVLDPEQNKNFQDTYLEVPVDLSKVLFLCTANYLENIPAPLMDRMEIIDVPSYLPEEKVEIAASHLTPKFLKEAGLSNAQVQIDKDTLRFLVRKYTKEAGVRGLSKTLEKIYRKVAMKFVKQLEDDGTIQDQLQDFSINIDSEQVSKFIGPPAQSQERMYDVLPPGVSMGLGWTPVGGMPLYIESLLQEPLSLDSKPRITRTGQLGEVMTESTSIAYSFSRMFMASNYPRNKFFEHAVIHTHFPEGAIKKDGPSAGITMVTSLLSLAMNIPMNNNLAMTGELSLTGKVLPIGGLREKAIAAKTAGATIIAFPYGNKPNWDVLPKDVKEGIEARPVKTYADVFEIAFGDVDAAKVNAQWPELQTRESSKPQQSAGISV